MKTRAFQRFAGLAAILAGVVGLLYSFAFVVLVVGGQAPELGVFLSALCLMLGGLFSSAALVAVFDRVREANPALALWGALLSLTGALGSVIHAGYDLANAVNPPPSSVPGLADLPSQIDPRGLLTFGIAGLGLFVLASLMARCGSFPRPLGLLGSGLAVLLVVIYLGRLIILSPTNPLVAGLIVVTGFIVNPAWYIWLGVTLMRTSPGSD
jgi:hypothetical protein